MSEKKEAQGKALEPRQEARKTQLREGARQVWRTAALRRCLEWGLRLTLAAVLASGKVLGGCGPFGVALVAACGAGPGGFAALLGAAGGYLLSRGLDEALRYTACSILVFAVSFAFYDLAVYKKTWFMPASAALLNALTGLVSLQHQVRLHPSLFLSTLVGETALTALSTFAFRVVLALPHGRREALPQQSLTGARGAEAVLRRQLCLALTAMALLISLAPLRLMGTVSPGRIMALWLTLWAGYTFGVGSGAALGLCAGLAMDLACHSAQLYAPAFAFSGLAVGLLRKKGRFFTAVACAVIGVPAVLWLQNGLDPVSGVAEVLLAGGVFLAVPQRLLDRFSPLLSSDSVPLPDSLTARTAQRQLRQTAAALQQVFSSLRGALSARDADADRDPAVIYDRAADRICGRCALRERCWQSQYQDTHDLLNAALPGLLEARRATATDFPPRFRDRCVDLPGFVSAVDEELRAYLLRQHYDLQVDRSRRAMCRQYAQLAEVLEDAAAAMAAPCVSDPAKTRRLSRFLAGRELRCEGVVFTDPQGRLHLRLTGPDAAALASPTAVDALSSVLETPLVLTSAPTEEEPQTLLRQREPLSALAGVSGRKKAGETVSGDACAWFKDDSGQLYLLLCDGMGSGREARQESELAIDLLEKFLRAGFSPENALKTLDQAFCLRLEEALGFSTVDLLALDLFSGAATLYKLGSAPSYLKQGGTVRVLRGKSFPAGLSAEGGGVQTSPFSLRLGPGDCLALLTDGVFDEGEDDGWLRELLMRFEGDSPATLADAVVSRGDAAEDDKTALVLRVALRSAGDLSEPNKAAV